MSDQERDTTYSFGSLAYSMEVLIGFLTEQDGEKSHEAITVMLMQGLSLFGAGSVAMQQFFPVFEVIKDRIDGSDFQGALRQAALFQRQLDEIIEMVRQGQEANNERS